MDKDRYAPVMNEGGRVSPYVVRDKKTGKFVGVQAIIQERKLDSSPHQCGYCNGQGCGYCLYTGVR
jgi:hypothetical protein